MPLQPTKEAGTLYVTDRRLLLFRKESSKCSFNAPAMI